MAFKKNAISSGWYSSVDWAWACEPNGCWFGSQSGHMPGLQARSPVGSAWGVTTHWCFSPSLSPSLPLSLKNKQIKKTKQKQCDYFSIWLMKEFQTGKLMHWARTLYYFRENQAAYQEAYVSNTFLETSCMQCTAVNNNKEKYFSKCFLISTGMNNHIKTF